MMEVESGMGKDDMERQKERKKETSETWKLHCETIEEERRIEKWKN